MQHIDGTATQFDRKAQRDAHHGSMGKDMAYFEIGPSIPESINRGLLRDEERILIYLIGGSEGFDQIDGIGFISAQLGSGGMGVDCDVQDRSCSCLLFWVAPANKNGDCA